MKSTDLLQLVDNLQQAGKIHNLQQVCSVKNPQHASLPGRKPEYLEESRPFSGYTESFQVIFGRGTNVGERIFVMHAVTADKLSLNSHLLV